MTASAKNRAANLAARVQPRPSARLAARSGAAAPDADLGGRADFGEQGALLRALPHPAALLEMLGQHLAVRAANDEFAHIFEEFSQACTIGDCGACDAFDWRSRAEAMFNTGRVSDRFDLELYGPLGSCALSCALSWVETADARRSLLLFTATDRTSERKAENTLRKELLTDSLTSLPNRTGFVEQMEIALARPQDQDKPKQGYAAIALDLVRFRRVNESLGAMAGDELMITVARRIKSLLRANDTLGRIGGNEFAIFAHVGKGLTEVLQIAERVRQAFDAPVRLSTYLINVEVAMGCALTQHDESDAEDLLRQAQVAVRRSKKSGMLEIYRAQVLHESIQRFAVENRLREAIEAGALTLAFQPLVDLKTDEVKGFEVLSRWNDGTLGDLSPTEFIPVAEETGLIVPLGRWTLCETAQTLAAWDVRLGRPMPIMLNVNLSPVQMTRDDVPRAVAEALRLAGIDGQRLTIEITESALVADPAKTRQLLAALRAMDVTIAMDDFGTGFSNMASLQSLPIDLLKIDQSFVTDMMIDEDKTAIIHAIISLAGALGMQTTAEGIEQPEMVAALAALGCDYGQGYYFARPMPADEAYAYWLERSADVTS